MHDMSTGWWVLSAVMMVAFWTAIVWLVVTLVDTRRRDRPGREILDERLASGDLTVEEYRRLRDEMGDGPAPPARA